MSVDIVPVHALSADPADRRLFADWNAVHTATGRAVFGDQHSGWSLDEIRERRRGTQYAFTDLAAVRDGIVLGALAIAEPLRDNSDVAIATLDVHPDHRRRGTGTRLLQTLEEVVRAHGRHTVLAESEWADGGEDCSGLGFAARHGYAAAQTDIRSGMPLPADREPLVAWAQGAGRGDATAYDILVGWDAIPDAWLDDRAMLQQRMSTDAPLGDLDLAEEAWDGDRVREQIGWVVASGRRFVEAVARDNRSGRLVGFSRVEVSTESPDVGYQQDTLVLKEARGHGLGLRLKARVALEVMEHLPRVRVVRTWNAETNSFMLAVNRRLGYRVEGHLREWQKRLAG